MRTRQIGMGPGSITPMVKNLLIVNGAVFVLQLLMGGGLGISSGGEFHPFGAYFALIPEFAVESGFVWQLVTYQFLHGGFFHILINMLILWMFGTELERVWNPMAFLRFYLICGIAAGLSMIVFNYGSIPVVGASGSIFGLIGAFAYLWPEREVYVWGIFPMKVKYFVLFVGGIELIMGITDTRLGIAHAAHLGGLGMGLLYLRFSDPRQSILGFFKDWAKKQKIKKKKQEWKEQQKKREDMVKEADEILDKLRKLSWEELSDYEKKRIREISDKLDEIDK